MYDGLTAVTWSNFDEERSRIQYETKLKLAEDIQRKIVFAREGALSSEFIFGLELAKAIVLGLAEEKTDNQEELPLL